MKTFNAVNKWDKEVSFTVWKWYKDTVGTPLPCKVMEYSGHGGLWYPLVVVLFFGVGKESREFYALLVNIFVGLTTDLIIICVVKPLVGRKRPAYNAGTMSGSIYLVDQFSFPSGHATRMAMIATLVVISEYLYQVPSTTITVVTILWALSVMGTRVMLGRHHVLDVVVGAVIGVVHGICLMQVGWLQNHAQNAYLYREEIFKLFGRN